MRLVLIGGGGHARAVADVARAAGFEVRGALTPEASAGSLDFERLGDDSWIEIAPPGTAFHVAIGPRHGCTARSEMFERLSARGFDFPALVSPTALVRTTTQLGPGSVLMHRAILNVGASVGRNCIVNTAALVEHDCMIGDHCHLAPGVRLAGDVTVGPQCILGVGAVVLPGVVIATGVTIGAGAVVVHSIEESGTVWSGNPARRHR